MELENSTDNYNLSNSFNDIKRKFDTDLKGKYCIEIIFGLNNNDRFNNCWMGKMPHEKTGGDLYWFGLTEDGKGAYDFDSFEKMSEAKVFDGKSLKDVWESVEIYDVLG